MNTIPNFNNYYEMVVFLADNPHILQMAIELHHLRGKIMQPSDLRLNPSVSLTSPTSGKVLLNFEFIHDIT
jgi:hypothetical protein